MKVEAIGLNRAEVMCRQGQYLTAFGALVEYGHIKKNDPVLLTATSSSVGLASIQISKAAGALAIATTRGMDKKVFFWTPPRRWIKSSLGFSDPFCLRIPIGNWRD